ncbi:hypothetical protein GCM10010508_59250 [Streptomyces naganishii JCM 4654]|uniref:Uncharacterized protein n=1 Tax=Streptomyces naganishii JCM 4654 TaxID=1306179 RepID=A0A919CZU7_9ACTN|nr:hypothetical protein GCM10010508_59250 [Streptomyces naganishii JCM 4654]
MGVCLRDVVGVERPTGFPSRNAGNRARPAGNRARSPGARLDARARGTREVPHEL